MTVYDHWEHKVITCPICSSDAILSGETDVVHWNPDQYREIPPHSLGFFPDSFQCDECGLTLDDYDELNLAGISTDFDDFDRTDELEEYLAQRHGEGT